MGPQYFAEEAECLKKIILQNNFFLKGEGHK